MSELIRVSLFVLGLLGLVGGLYQAVEIWPKNNNFNDLMKDTDELIGLLEKGRQREIIAFGERRDLAKALQSTRKVTAIYWAAAGITSWAVLWGLAAMLYELQQIRSVLLGRTNGRIRSKELTSKEPRLSVGPDSR